MSSDPAFVAALAVGAFGVFAILVALWRYSGQPEQPAGPWERPPNVATPSPVPPGFRLALEVVESDWSDQSAWRELVARLDGVARSVQAGPPPTAAPIDPDRTWITTELDRLEQHLAANPETRSHATKGPAR